MMTEDRTATTYWVCVDCYQAHAGIDEHERGEAYTNNPLSLISDTAEVSAGLLWAEHDEECANHIAQEWLEECSCEHREFTWSWCHGCGSTLGGAREALTVWGE